MLTLPVGAGRAANRPARILVIGRSETVLSEAVMILRDKGYAAGATNEFDRTLDLFDAAQLDLVVFGGMVPPDTREHLREQISTRNPAVAFVQGYAGIPGLIAAQVEAALSGGATGPAASVRYDPRSRSIGISLDGPQDVTVIAWWATSFVPPEPKSTSRVILDEEFPAGAHTIAIPDRVRTRVDVLDESRACGGPAEKLPRRGAGRREVHAEEGADPPEMTLDVIRGDRYDGKGEGAADGLRDVAGGYAVFRDGVQASAGRSLRESQGDEACGIGPVHGGPPVGPVSRVTGDALCARRRGDRRDEPVVASSVHGRRKAQAHGVHAAVDGVDAAPPDASPLEVIASALHAAALLFPGERRPYSRMRQSVIEQNPALRERELHKLASLAATVAEALRARGIGEPAATLAAESGATVFAIAFAQWIREGEMRSLADIASDVLHELLNLTGTATGVTELTDRAHR